MSSHPAFSKGCVAVITGAAAGIGLAAARRCGEFGMTVVLADFDEDNLKLAVAAVAATGAPAHAALTDVSKVEEMERLQSQASALGPVTFCMLNAGIERGGSVLDSAHYSEWADTLAVNLWGVLHGLQSFANPMIAHGKPGLIVVTGSKQGITCPPGNTIYNVSKAGVKVATEALQHELRNKEGCQVTAHLLVPGWTNTNIRLNVALARDRSSDPSSVPFSSEKPHCGAWSADQVVDELLAGIGRNDFYIICPDNEVTRELDRKRITWAAGDVANNRPPLSRWHPDYAAAFKDFLEQ